MDANLIYKAIKDRGFNINTVAKSVGMTHTGLTKAIDKGTIRVETLEQIAKVVGVSTCYFFDPNNTIPIKEDKFEKFKFYLYGGNVSISINSYVESLLEDEEEVLRPVIGYIQENCSEKIVKKIFLEKEYINKESAVDELINEISNFSTRQTNVERIKDFFNSEVSEKFGSSLEEAVYESSILFLKRVVKDESICYLLEEELIGQGELINTLFLTLTGFFGYYIERLLDDVALFYNNKSAKETINIIKKMSGKGKR